MRVCVVCVLRVRLATVQQQSRSKVVWTTSMRVLTLHVYINMHMYDMCALICDGCVVAYATTTIYCLSRGLGDVYKRQAYSYGHYYYACVDYC